MNKRVGLFLITFAFLVITLTSLSSAANDYGCTESGNIVNCTGGTFTGTFITTDKNIIISGATMRTTGFGGGSAVSATWNSSAGNITIIGSTIDGYGGSSGGVSSGASATFNLYGGPNGTFIDSSTINAYGGGASCATNGAANGGSGNVNFILSGNLTYTSGVTINAYGNGGCGNGNGNFGAGGNGNFNSFAINTFVLTNRLYVKADGGNAGTGGSSGSGTAQAGDGSAIFRDLNITTVAGTNITVDAFGGQASAGHGTQLKGGGRFGLYANQLVNSTFHVNFNAGGSGGGTRVGQWIILNSSDGITNNLNRYILRNSTFQGGQAQFILSEFTLLGVTQSSFTPIVNSSGDIFRIGNFDSNMALGLNYLNSFGAFVVNGTNSFINLNGAVPVNRSLVDYYYPMHKLISPASMSSHVPGGIIFNTTYISEYFIPSNITFYIYNSTGVFNITTVATSAERANIGLNVSMLQNGNYQWNALLTSLTNLQQWWYGISNYSFSIGAFVNSETYNTSSYETASESFLANVSAGGNTISSARLSYAGVNYTATVTGSNSSYILSRTIDIPLGAGTNNFFWSITLGDGTLINTPTRTQAIGGINLTLCTAAPQNTPFLNFSFKDENTLANVNATTDLATFEYYLGSGGVSRNLLYQNAVQNNSYTFCFSPINRTLIADVNYQYSGTNYPQRGFTNLYSTLTSSVTQQILYLLSADDGIYVTIQTVNNLGNIISGVEVTLERDISGTPTVVGQGVTDAAGSVTFWLNPNFEHTFAFSKTGCTPSEFTVTPTQTTYTVTLTCEGDSNYDTSPIPGIIFQKSPPSGPIVVGNTTFRYSVLSVSQNVSIEKAKFLIMHANGTVIKTNETLVSSGFSFCTLTQCNLTLSYDIQKGDDLKGQYFVDVGDGYVLIEGDARWRAIRASPSRTLSLKNAFQDLRSIFEGWTEPTCSYSIDGLQGTDCTLDELELQNKLEYSRFVFFFLVLAILLALLGRATGYDGANPGIFIYIVGGLIVVGSMIGGLTEEGYFYYSNLTPFHFLNNYILAFTMIMLMIGYWCMLSRRQT